MLMADGANRAFRKAGRKFLKDNIIEVDVMVSELIKVADNHTDANKALLAARGRVLNLKGSVVEPNLPVNPTVAAGIYDFDLVKSPRKGERPNTTLGIAHTTSVPVYNLKAWGTKQRDQIVTPHATGFTVQYQTPVKAHPISAYWVPWSSGSCWSVRLGNDADYFFTPTMDGCSLAISSGASPVVTHGNYKSARDPNLASQARTVRRINQQHTALGTDVNRTLLKSAYVATPQQKAAGLNHLVTVVGFRDRATSTWSFYYQKRLRDYNDPNSALVLQDRMVAI
jgi:hypothetical protein